MLCTSNFILTDMDPEQAEVDLWGSILTNNGINSQGSHRPCLTHQNLCAVYSSINISYCSLLTTVLPMFDLLSASFALQLMFPLVSYGLTWGRNAHVLNYYLFVRWGHGTAQHSLVDPRPFTCDASAWLVLVTDSQKRLPHTIRFFSKFFFQYTTTLLQIQ